MAMGAASRAVQKLANSAEADSEPHISGLISGIGN